MLPLTEQGSPVDESNGRLRNSARIPALRHTREEVDMVVAGQQRLKEKRKAVVMTQNATPVCEDGEKQTASVLKIS